MKLPKLDTPVYELNIPSTKKILKYRPFLVKEHKILLTMIEASDDEIGRIVKEIISSCTLNDIDVDELTYFDLEYIFLKLRSKSIGEAVNVQITCACGSKINTTYNIDDLELKINEEHSSIIQLNDSYGIMMQYPSLHEIISVYSKKDTSSVIDLVINNVRSIFNKDNLWEAKDLDKKEIEEFVLSLTKEQFEKIETFFQTAPKVSQKIEGDCASCNTHQIRYLEGLSNFFV
jgi:hypothetical protein